MNKLCVNFITLIGAAIPIISLTSCNTTNPSSSIVFNVDKISMTNCKEASFVLTWFPAETDLNLSNFKFKYDSDSKEASINVNSNNKNKSINVNLLFYEDITDDDIVDGKLSFHYKGSGYDFDKTIYGIFIPKYDLDFEFIYDKENKTAKLNKYLATSDHVVIPDIVKYRDENYSVTSLDSNCFRDNENISFVIIGNNIQSIDDNSFSDCTNLKFVCIPKSVSSIGNDAFWSCKSLKDDSSPEGKFGFNFTGTISDWAKIVRHISWRDQTPATEIQCSDGVSNLDP